LQQLYKLQMHNKEAIINFVSRFRNRIQVLSNTTTNPQDMPTDKELSTFFIDKLCANASITGVVRHVLLDCKRELHSPASSQTLTAFEDQLCLAESQAFRGSTSNSSSPSHPIICEFCGKKGIGSPCATPTPATATDTKLTMLKPTLAAAVDAAPTAVAAAAEPAATLSSALNVAAPTR
jgi:hypothetical protein